MTNKKRYYALDEIGFVGTQQKISKSQMRKDMEMTGQYIRAQKAGKVVSFPQKKARTRLAAK